MVETTKTKELGPFDYFITVTDSLLDDAELGPQFGIRYEILLWLLEKSPKGFIITRDLINFKNKDDAVEFKLRWS